MNTSLLIRGCIPSEIQHVIDNPEQKGQKNRNDERNQHHSYRHMGIPKCRIHTRVVVICRVHNEQG